MPTLSQFIGEERHLLRWILTQALRNKSQQMVRGVAEEAVRHVKDGDVEAQAEEVEEFPQPDVIVLFALAMEASPFIQRLDSQRRFRWKNFKGSVGLLKGRRVMVLQTGVGKRAARKFITEIATLAPAEVAWVSAGFAGALMPEMKRGDFFMASESTDGSAHYELSVHVSEETFSSTPYLHSGKLLTVDRIVGTREDREALASEHGAAACDMETSEIVAALKSKEFKLTSVRIISDGVDDDIPVEVSKLLSQTSVAGKIGAATGALFQRPSVAKDLWNLRDQASKAANRLAGFLCGIVEQV
jgi:adenosylhomocysteine nucleosidase